MAIDEFLTADKITVEHNKDSFEFRVPSVEDEIALGFIERQLRRDFEERAMSDEQRLTRRPIGDPDGLDFNTYARVQAIAVFKQLLVKTDAKNNWCWSSDQLGKPIVDYRKWDSSKMTDAMRIATKFWEALARFRQSGNTQDSVSS